MGVITRKTPADTISTIKLMLFRLLKTERIAYVELTAQGKEPPEIRVFGDNDKSVKVRITALPFCVFTKWGSKKGYYNLALGLNLLLNWRGRYDRIRDYQRSLRTILHPHVPPGRVVRYFHYTSGKRRQIINPKR